MPKFGTSEYVLYQDSLITKTILVCFYASQQIFFVLNFWWCILQNIVNISQLQSQQCLIVFFLTRVIFTVSVFPLWYTPAVPRELGAQRKFGGGGTGKKNFPALFLPEFVPPTSKPCRRLCSGRRGSGIFRDIGRRIAVAAGEAAIHSVSVPTSEYRHPAWECRQCPCHVWIPNQDIFF